MLDANISHNNNTSTRRPRVYVTLTKSQRAKLRRVTLGHGNMITCELATGKNRELVLRAISGGRLLPENADILIDYLTNYGVKKQ